MQMICVIHIAKSHAAVSGIQNQSSTTIRVAPRSLAPRPQGGAQCRGLVARTSIATSCRSSSRGTPAREVNPPSPASAQRSAIAWNKRRTISPRAVSNLMPLLIRGSVGRSRRRASQARGSQPCLTMHKHMDEQTKRPRDLERCHCHSAASVHRWRRPSASRFDVVVRGQRQTASRTNPRERPRSLQGLAPTPQ